MSNQMKKAVDEVVCDFSIEIPPFLRDKIESCFRTHKHFPQNSVWNAFGIKRERNAICNGGVFKILLMQRANRGSVYKVNIHFSNIFPFFREDSTYDTRHPIFIELYIGLGVFDLNQHVKGNQATGVFGRPVTFDWSLSFQRPIFLRTSTLSKRFNTLRLAPAEPVLPKLGCLDINTTRF